MSDAILSLDPDDRKSVAKVIEEIVNSKIKAKSEGEYQREAIKELSEGYDIPAAHIRKLVAWRFKMDYSSQKSNTEEQFDAYEMIFGSQDDE